MKRDILIISFVLILVLVEIIFCVIPALLILLSSNMSYCIAYNYRLTIAIHIACLVLTNKRIKVSDSKLSLLHRVSNLILAIVMLIAVLLSALI